MKMNNRTDHFEKRDSEVEDRKTIIVAGIAGAALGLLYSSVLDFWVVVGLVLGTLFGIAIGIRMIRKPPKMRYPKYLLRRTLMAVAFLFLTIYGYEILMDQELNNTQAFLATLLPWSCWIALVVSLSMMIANLDELQRRIQTEAIAIGFAGTAIVVGGYALLQFVGFAQINIGIVILIMSFMWLIGKLWTLWKYR
jgi:hypothetical protein